jgi:HEAT repeat protein
MAMDKEMQTLLEQFRSADPAVVSAAVSRAETLLRSAAGAEKRSLLDALLQLFYFDLYDRPEMAAVQEKAMAAVSRVAADGEILEVLMEHLRYPDLKASLTVARVLGRTGKPAIAPLLDFYRTQADPYVRAMALHALSKIRDAEVLEAGDLVLEALKDAHAEVRHTAARTVGKYCAYFQPGQFLSAWADRAFTALLGALSDPYPPVRAKALRSLGKMARGGFLRPPQTQQLEQTCLKVIGKTDFNWDPAYIVRVEADEVLKLLKG